MPTEERTHFGYREVAPDEKTHLVKGVFDSVAQRYDLMNDLMSFGTHRLWKRFAVGQCSLRRGMSVLDLASGTGDMVRLMKPRVGEEGEIVSADICTEMLNVGRDKSIDKGVAGVQYIACAGEELPFEDDRFDCVVMSFGLRNATDKEKVIAEVYRVLKSGGRFVILEFSKPKRYLDKCYEMYSFNVIPLLGKCIVSDEDSYRYLVESIRRHPDQATLLKMMENAGFEYCKYHNLSAGIVAVHRGYKI